MRPVHQVVRVVTHCSEAWKVGSTLPRNTNHHSKEPESTRFARRFCGIRSPCTSNEDRLSKTARHLCLSHKTAETTGNHLQVSSDLSWRNPGGTVETYCGLWSPGKTSSRTPTLFAQLVADFLCCLLWQDTYGGFISGLSAIYKRFISDL